MTTERRLTMTVPEAAKLLGIGKTLAYEAAHAGEIPTIKIGRRLLVPVAQLERMVAGAQASVDPPGPQHVAQTIPIDGQSGRKSRVHS